MPKVAIKAKKALRCSVAWVALCDDDEKVAVSRGLRSPNAFWIGATSCEQQPYLISA